MNPHLQRLILPSQCGPVLEQVHVRNCLSIAGEDAKAGAGIRSGGVATGNIGSWYYHLRIGRAKVCRRANQRYQSQPQKGQTRQSSAEEEHSFWLMVVAVRLVVMRIK